MGRGRRLRPLVAALLAAFLLGGCGGTASAPDGGAVRGQLVVFAAASLTDAFEELATGFEVEHPDLDVMLNLAGSSTLATQLVEGATADVLATADDRSAQVVVDAGLAVDPVPFATNGLAIAVERGNPLGIGGLTDLARDDVVLVLAAPEVPAGRAAAAALAAADVEVAPASFERDVRAALGKIALGEADAAVVYASDVHHVDGIDRDRVEGVAVPAEQDLTVTYPVVTLSAAPNPAAARAFVEHLTSDDGQAVLARHGFGPP